MIEQLHDIPSYASDVCIINLAWNPYGGYCIDFLGGDLVPMEYHAKELQAPF